MRRTVLLLIIIMQFIFVEVIFAQTPSITKGLFYLISIQNPDGSWGTEASGTDILPSTVSVIKTLQVLNQTNTSNYANAISWLQTQDLETTDYLAERIHALSTPEADINLLLSYLDEIYTGAWGGYDDYEVNNLDTALALQALKAVNYSNQNVINAAISYLTSTQNSDGGWGFKQGMDSEIFYTARVSFALQQFPQTTSIATAINKATAFLIAHQNADGGFGSSAATAYETALSYIALINSGQGSAQVLQNAINYLILTQQANGSWNDDPYSTALALRALAHVKPNLSITSSDIALSNTMPPAGEVITITATIKNSGLNTASGVVARFYSGDPASGGGQIGTDQVIPFLGIGSSAQVAQITGFIGTGNRTIFVIVDPDNIIAETNETDNNASTHIWVATAPDLAVYSEDIKPSTYIPTSGAAFTLEYKIRNLGESSVAGFDVALYDGQPSGLPLQTTHISGLNGTEVRTGTIGVTLASNGAHTLYLVADSGKQITELSEVNNSGTVTVTVGGVQTYADLAITTADITLNPSRPSAGDSVAITARIRNQGMESANNFLVEIYDGAPESGGILINSQTVSSSPAADELAIAANWTITSSIHDLYIILDKANTVIETNEANNRASVRIMPDMVDISISAMDLTFNPSHPVVGDTVALSITAHNLGIRDTGSFNISLYDGDPASGGALLQTYPIANITGDVSATLTYTFLSEAKTYRFYAIADTENQVVEMYEENNQAIRSVTIKGPGETLGPDLVPIKIDISGVTTDPQTLAITGTAKVTLQNKGDEKITTNFDVLIFEDKDNDARYTAGVDTALGIGTNTLALWPEGANIVDVPLSGNVQFLHSPFYAFVDSGDVIREQDETNNILMSCKDCQVVPTNLIQANVKWRWKDTTSAYSGIYTPPTIMYLRDTNNDGKIDQNDIPDLVLSTRIGDGTTMKSNIWAVKGDTGENYLKLYDPNHAPYTISYPVSGDIDGDRKPEIIIPISHAITGAGGFVVYKNDWTLKWDDADQVTAWNAAHPPNYAGLRDDGISAIADLDGDGSKEIIMGPTVINADGSVRCAKDHYLATGDGSMMLAGGAWLINYSVSVADLYLNGRQEIIAGNTAYDSNCNIKWWNKSLTDGVTAVANFNDDPYPEIVFIGYHPTTGHSLYLLDHNGTIIWGPISIWQLVGSTYAWDVSLPMVADIDGDGKPEIVVRSTNKIFAFNKDGQLKKTITIPHYSSGYSITAPTIFDLDGDGVPEVLININGYFMILSGKDGSVLFQDAFGGDHIIIQTVLIADVDGDGHVEAVVIGFNDSSKLDGMRVYGSADPSHPWVNGRRIWNQHSYHVTNVNDDGSIPQHEAPSWLLNNTYRTQAAIGPNPNPYRTPNLTASSLRAAQDGTSMNLTVRIGNGGAKEAAAGIVVTFYDGMPSPATLIGTTSTTKTLQPGEYQDIIFSWSGVTEGNYQIYAVVDDANNISECLEDDNQANLNFTIQAGLPDLKVGIEDITLPTGPYTEGSLIPISVWARNIGSVEAANIPVRLYSGNPMASGVPVDVRTIQNISTGGTSEIQFIYDTLGHSGTNILYIAIDPENRIPEANEYNNTVPVNLTIDAPQSPDLIITAEDIQIAPSSATEGDTVTITALITNRGSDASDIPVKIYLGDPLSGGALISQQTIHSIISLGQTATIRASLSTTGLQANQTIFIAIDPANAITESREDNNTGSKTVFIESAGIASTLTLDKSVYRAEEPVIATISVSNTSASLQSLSLVLTVKDSAGNVISTIPQTGPLNIEPNGTVTMSQSWNTGKTLAGDYNVTAELSESGRVVSRKSANFTITPDKRLDTKVSAGKMQYNPKENVALASVVTSMSENYIFEDLLAEVNISDQSGLVLFTETRSITSLTLGSIFTFKTNWNTSSYATKGTYKALLKILSGGAVTNTTSTTFEILGSSETGDGLIGTITASSNPVYQGRDETITYAITNKGNEDIANLKVKILIVNPDTQEIKNTFENTISLAINTIATGNFITQTINLTPRIYLAMLQISSGTMAQPKTLASTTFEVKPSLEITKTIPDIKRVLVWLNYPWQSGQNCPDKALIEQALNEAGVSYHIVLDKKDLEAELRNPYYTDFMILGDHNPIEDHFSEELREQIYSGEGLISSMFNRQNLDSDLFGINFNGHLSDTDYPVNLLQSGISEAGILQLYGRALNIEAINPSENIGWISETSKKGITDYPAVIKRSYGNGNVLFFAFDLGFSIQNYDQFATLLKNSLNFIHKPVDTTMFYPAQLIPIEIKVKSLGGVFDIRLTETYPSDLKLYYPSTGQWITDNPWVINMSLSPNETKTILDYALAPDRAGAYNLQTEVGYMDNGTYNFYQSLSTDMVVDKDTAVLTADIITALKALSVSGQEKARVDNAIRYITDVQGRAIISAQDIEMNIRDILKAIDSILSVTSANTFDIRTMMDELLEIWMSKYYFGR